jgi:hypothetical protein
VTGREVDRWGSVIIPVSTDPYRMMKERGVTDGKRTFGKRMQYLLL